jgi:glycosyltransferase involved in cell wall biosynthesis
MLTFLNRYKMIKVGFLLNFPLDYKGGINYLKNLFYAVNKFHQDKVEIILFVSSDISSDYLDMFTPYATVVKTKILKRKSFPWLLSKIGGRFFDYDILTYNLLLKHKVSIVSHSNFVFPNKKIKTLNWIPDFQYIHFSDLWTEAQLNATKNLHENLIKKSDVIVLSSYAAFDDFKINHLNYREKVHVLNFVSQPDQEVEFLIKNEENKEIKKVYNIDQPFFYLPNQFWSHKNHIIVFEAIKLLKDKGLNPLLVTSGLMSDYRNGANHVEKLFKYVSDNSLKGNILFLGLIPYSNVIKLILMAECIINPSYFEGWSSTVEEAKTVGKRILLSNIPVHLEQAPQYGIYFDPNNAIELADKMEKIIQDSSVLSTNGNELRTILDNRTEDFAFKYLEILNSLI